MSASIPKQHPAVVLRSQYQHMRAFLGLALVLVVALAGTVTVLAVNDDDPVVSKSEPAAALGVGPTGAPGATTSPRKEIALRRSTVRIPVTATPRYDGGPDEGTRGPGH